LSQLTFLIVKTQLKPLSVNLKLEKYKKKQVKMDFGKISVEISRIK